MYALTYLVEQKVSDKKLSARSLTHTIVSYVHSVIQVGDAALALDLTALGLALSTPSFKQLHTPVRELLVKLGSANVDVTRQLWSHSLASITNSFDRDSNHEASVDFGAVCNLAAELAADPSAPPADCDQLFELALRVLQCSDNASLRKLAGQVLLPCFCLPGNPAHQKHLSALLERLQTMLADTDNSLRLLDLYGVVCRYYTGLSSLRADGWEDFLTRMLLQGLRSPVTLVRKQCLFTLRCRLSEASEVDAKAAGGASACVYLGYTATQWSAYMAIFETLEEHMLHLIIEIWCVCPRSSFQCFSNGELTLFAAQI